MKVFFHLLKQDFRLLNRNNIITVSILVTGIYIALFHWLSRLEDTDKILVLVIFNDPVLIGFLFAGVMVLFEKNENTLEALAVSPATRGQYILSKSLALTLIATLCCFAMVIAGRGFQFHVVHLAMASLLTTFMFSFLGFILVAGESSFNRFLLKTVGIMIFMAIPFLGFFGLSSRQWFLWIPTQPAIDLFQASLSPSTSYSILIYAYATLIFWNSAAYYLASKMIHKSFIS